MRVNREILTGILRGLVATNEYLSSAAKWSPRWWQEGIRLSLLGTAFYEGGEWYQDVEVFLRRLLWTFPGWAGYDLNQFNSDDNINFDCVKRFLRYAIDYCEWCIAADVTEV